LQRLAELLLLGDGSLRELVYKGCDVTRKITTSSACCMVGGVKTISPGSNWNPLSTAYRAFAASRVNCGARRLISTEIPVPMQFSGVGPIVVHFAGPKIWAMNLVAKITGSLSVGYDRQNLTSTFCRAKGCSLARKALTTAGVKSCVLGDISIILVCKLARIVSAISSACLPHVLSIQSPPSTTKPASTTQNPFNVQIGKCDLSKSIVLFLWSTGYAGGFSTHKASIAISRSIPTARMKFPQSRTERATLREIFSPSFIKTVLT